MHDGQKCLCFHFKLKALGYKGTTLTLAAYIEHPKGSGVNDTNGKYCSSDGKVVSSIRCSCTYESSIWDDLKIYLPHSEIHPLPGNNTYYVRAIVLSGKTKIAETYCDGFNMDGGAKRETSEREKSSGSSGDYSKTGGSSGGTYGKPIVERPKVSSDPVTFYNVWIEKDVRHGDAICLAVHANFSVNDFKGKRAEVGVMFKDNKGNFLKDINKRFFDTDNNIWVSGQTDKSKYYDVTFDDFTLYIPINEIHGHKGNQNYTAVLFVKVRDKWYTSPVQPVFSMYQDDDYVQCHKCHGEGKVKCALCNNGQKVELRQSPFFPYPLVRHVVNCDYCKGTGKSNCAFCNGSGILSKTLSENMKKSSERPIYSAPSIPSTVPSPSPSAPTTAEETRQIKCTWCNGHGLVRKNYRCPLEGSHECNRQKCPECGDIHCTHETSHQRCPSCDGTGYKKQKKVRGEWINVF